MTEKLWCSRGDVVMWWSRKDNNNIVAFQSKRMDDKKNCGDVKGRGRATMKWRWLLWRRKEET